MSTTKINRRLPRGSPLAAMCRQLLDREHGRLKATLDTLRNMRVMLSADEPSALTQMLEKSTAAAEAVGDLTEQRNQFRETASRLLNVPAETVTLRFAAEYLPDEEATDIQHRRTQLLKLAAEVQQANRGNAMVVWWCLDFVQQVFAEIHGQPIGGRYGAAGRVQPAVTGPTWQGQG